MPTTLMHLLKLTNNDLMLIPWDLIPSGNLTVCYGIDGPYMAHRNR